MSSSDIDNESNEHEYNSNINKSISFDNKIINDNFLK